MTNQEEANIPAREQHKNSSWQNKGCKLITKGGQAFSEAVAAPLFLCDELITEGAQRRDEPKAYDPVTGKAVGNDQVQAS
mmetsp:Transcript_21563/g.46732  ORF Transcript_21563/g.46732 Transcript_21563/m.46732 type:complete len:80 (-) Transcript_21563:129-368(-)|eukprot:CAMPEP_0168741032 /NCGR_PEP_ID=MMETSP0724-20121128/12293_1 /TAXON_ID=265536 /ORGANISM="Amphiprora sp., Strain CCMP467" /LENGTH=79 /DNA_ID=CAMNT_0008788501 /DNA_START=29 /DNA_END=268 /DNA_ORIENTATION=-